MEAAHVFTTLFGLAVVFGVLAMMLNDPTKTNAAFKAGSDTIRGVTLALEGRPL